ncbi:MAG TPA: RNA 2',3'-cyclic phosphodiesterase [Methylophilaceae bacterium]|nr:RNA 2',3'-cyclic phosphodiesterase [Methylophilaceae bacterium]
MPRLFVAIDLPMAVTMKLALIQPPAMPGLRLVMPDQMHLTLHFVGEVYLARLAAVLETVKFSPFELTIEGVGQFPTSGRAAVLWAGVRENAELMQLHDAIGIALAKEGFKLEARHYAPHITLARCKPDIPKTVVQAFLNSGASFTYSGIKVERFVLYSSTVVNHAPLYRKERLFS